LDLLVVSLFWRKLLKIKVARIEESFLATLGNKIQT